MPIHHNLKTIHIHIPKTGGTSVNETIFNKKELDIKKVNKKIFYGNLIHVNNYFYELDHSTINFLKKNHNNYFKSYFKFCYVRNPYSRIVSEYLFCKEKFSRFITNTNTFEDFVLELKEKFNNVMENIELNHWLVSHYIPQYYFIYDNNNKCCIDYIGRFEKINSYWKQIAKRIKIKKNLKRSNVKSSFKYDWRTFYNEDLKNIIYDLYKIDFKTFNYEKNFDIPVKIFLHNLYEEIDFKTVHYQENGNILIKDINDKTMENKNVSSLEMIEDKNNVSIETIQEEVENIVDKDTVEQITSLEMIPEEVEDKDIIENIVSQDMILEEDENIVNKDTVEQITSLETISEEVQDKDTIENVVSQETIQEEVENIVDKNTDTVEQITSLETIPEEVEDKDTVEQVVSLETIQEEVENIVDKDTDTVEQTTSLETILEEVQDKDTVEQVASLETIQEEVEDTVELITSLETIPEKVENIVSKKKYVRKQKNNKEI